MRKTKVLFLGLILLLVAGAFVFATGQAAAPDMAAGEPIKFKILTMSYGANKTEYEPFETALSEYTNAIVEMEFISASIYKEKLDIAILSGDLPEVIRITDPKDPIFADAAESGQFWDITDKVGNYKMLSQLPEVAWMSSALRGKNYGIFCSRPLVRFGLPYRTDLGREIGIPEIKSWQNFVDYVEGVKKAHPEMYPFFNAMGTNPVSRSPIAPYTVFNGGPNSWGPDKDGKITPSFLFDEEREVLDLFRSWYARGLYHPDSFSGGNGNDFYQNGVTAIGGFGMSDAATPDWKENLDLIVYLEDPKGVMRAHGGGGYNGMYSFPTKTVKDEAFLGQLIGFFDKCLEPEMRKLFLLGIEGIHYDTGADGTPKVRPDSTWAGEYGGNFWQVFTGEYFAMALDTEMYITRNPTSGEFIRFLFNKRKFAQDYAIREYYWFGESETLMKEKATIDTLIQDAMINYVANRITEEELEAAIDRWLAEGGEKVIEEMTESYNRFFGGK